MDEPQEKKRIFLLDEIRGFAVVCMVVHHALLSIGDIFLSQFFINLFNWLCVFQPIFWFLFFGASGISSMLSRNNLVRGAKLFGIAMVVTAVTFVFFNGTYTIVFGVLHFLAVAMMLFHFLKPLFLKMNAVAGIIVSFCLFAFTFGIYNGYVGLFGVLRLYLPSALYSTPFLFWLGFPEAGFASADYFPLLPHIFLFFIGCFLGTFVIKGRVPAFAYKSRIKFLSFLGRHALLVYIAHQPVIYALCYLVKWIGGM